MGPSAGSATARRHETIERQLAAMGAHRYVIGVHHRAEDRLYRLANLTAEQVLAHDRSFAALNIRGRDLYIAPVHNGGLILLDDLPAVTIARLHGEGMDPALVVETSPANFQAWIRVAPDVLPKDLATAVSRELAMRYGGDRGSVGGEHLGRLAGYTNQKPGRTLPDGRHPWVRLHEAGGRQAPGGDALVAGVHSRLEAVRTGPAVPTLDWSRLETQAAARVPLMPDGLAREFAARVAHVLERQRARGDRPDISAADWAVVGTLHQRYPGLSPAHLAQAMRQGSPRLEERHPGHVADYVGRTVVKALQAQQDDQQRPRAGPSARPDAKAARQDAQTRESGDGARDEEVGRWRSR